MNILFVLTIIVIVGLLFKPISGIFYKRKPLSANAKVVFKDIWGGGKHKMAGGRYITVSNGYRITFELDDYKNLTLIVPKKIYDGLSVDSTGVLDYNGNEFVNFSVIY